MDFKSLWRNNTTETMRNFGSIMANIHEIVIIITNVENMDYIFIKYHNLNELIEDMHKRADILQDCKCLCAVLNSLRMFIQIVASSNTS